MAELINYLLESTFWLGIFFLVYQTILRRIKWPIFNRFFLLFGLILSVFLPLLHLDLWYSQPQPFIINLGEAVENISSNALSTGQVNQDTSGNLLPWPIFIYVSVSALLFLRLIFSLTQIYFYKKNPNHLPDNLLAFSYFNFIYLHPVLQEKEHSDLIFMHEKAHAIQWHSLDILLIQVIRIVCWANPMLWIYHKSLRETHEYLADQNVLQEHPERAIAYKQQILNLQLGLIQPSLVNNFNILPYKKRIAMINKKQVNRQGKKILVLSMFLFALTLFACKEIVDDIGSDKIYSFEEIEISRETYRSNIYKYIQKNISYPSEARKNGVSGKYFISFTLDENGFINNPSISKKTKNKDLLQEVIVVGYGLHAPKVSKLGIEKLETEAPPKISEKDIESGELAMRQSLTSLFENIPEIAPILKDGKPVKVKMTLPIEFKLW